MFNPYVEQSEPYPLSAPSGVEGKPSRQTEGLLGRLGRLDSDDLLILLLIFLLAREGEGDALWPLVAAALYLML